MEMKVLSAYYVSGTFLCSLHIWSYLMMTSVVRPVLTFAVDLHWNGRMVRPKQVKTAIGVKTVRNDEKR